MTEIWKAVPGHVGRYEVSDHGRVRSLDRTVSDTGKGGTVRVRLMRGRALRAGRSSNGYLTVSLDGKSHTVQDLVLLAFVGPKPEGQVSRHENDIKFDNRLGNLLYGTQSQNARDSTRNGRRMFSLEQAAEIIRAADRGESQERIAARFQCSRRHVNYIVNGVHYAP